MKPTALIFMLMTLVPVTSAAAPAEKAPPTGVSTTTEHTFEDVLVQGKFEFSDEAVATVEEDKVLDSLIGVRTDFKDRLQQSAERF